MAQPVGPADVLLEYERLEAGSETKHELLGGTIVAMAGASPRHNRLVLQTASELSRLLAGRGCYVAAADQRVRPGEAEEYLYLYPDVVVACPPEFDEGTPRSLLNPRLVVEVLSPATEARDKSHKLDAYRRCTGLDDILLVKASHPLVEHHHRRDDHQWLVTLHVEGAVVLESLGVRLSLDQLYAGVDELPDDGAEPRARG